ncbi:hypothetical protein TRFO_18575 [Tritrichomonas foetus]|uniref:Uncharacterized protein n=1 Tax=Tritrichomonas foetus TaxID=1144522 RepID=A0A1J4KQ09_9EUKA|nr:hypothetical protein TRFO_18575 [Tritrichomonas foetus]|eukprot:OHT11876.1 hypothetical protein TRFO_18575 [Tritrichomonas foetus]
MTDESMSIKLIIFEEQKETFSKHKFPIKSKNESLKDTLVSAFPGFAKKLENIRLLSKEKIDLNKPSIYYQNDIIVMLNEKRLQNSNNDPFAFEFSVEEGTETKHVQISIAKTVQDMINQLTLSNNAKFELYINEKKIDGQCKLYDLDLDSHFKIVSLDEESSTKSSSYSESDDSSDSFSNREDTLDDDDDENQSGFHNHDIPGNDINHESNEKVNQTTNGSKKIGEKVNDKQTHEKEEDQNDENEEKEEDIYTEEEIKNEEKIKNEEEINTEEEINEEKEEMKIKDEIKNEEEINTEEEINEEKEEMKIKDEIKNEEKIKNEEEINTEEEINEEKEEMKIKDEIKNEERDKKEISDDFNESDGDNEQICQNNPELPSSTINSGKVPVFIKGLSSTYFEGDKVEKIKQQNDRIEIINKNNEILNDDIVLTKNDEYIAVSKDHVLKYEYKGENCRIYISEETITLKHFIKKLCENHQNFVMIEPENDFKHAIKFSKTDQFTLKAFKLVDATPIFKWNDKYFICKDFKKLRTFFRDQNKFVTRITFNEKEIEYDNLENYEFKDFKNILKIQTAKLEKINIDYYGETKTIYFDKKTGKEQRKMIIKNQLNIKSEAIHIDISNENKIIEYINIQSDNPQYKRIPIQLQSSSHSLNIKMFISTLNDEYEDDFSTDIDKDTKLCEINQNIVKIKGFYPIDIRGYKVNGTSTVQKVIDKYFPGKHFLIKHKIVASQIKIQDIDNKNIELLDEKILSITISINQKKNLLEIDNFEMKGEDLKNMIILKWYPKRTINEIKLKYRNRTIEDNECIFDFLPTNDLNIMVEFEVYFNVKCLQTNEFHKFGPFTKETVKSLLKKCKRSYNYVVKLTLEGQYLSESESLLNVDSGNVVVELVYREFFYCYKEVTKSQQIPDDWTIGQFLEKEFPNIPIIVRFGEKQLNLTVKFLEIKKNTKSNPLLLTVNYTFQVCDKTISIPIDHQRQIYYFASDLLAVKRDSKRTHVEFKGELLENQEITFGELDYHNGDIIQVMKLPPILNFKLDNSQYTMNDNDLKVDTIKSKLQEMMSIDDDLFLQYNGNELTDDDIPKIEETEFIKICILDPNYKFKFKDIQFELRIPKFITVGQILSFLIGNDECRIKNKITGEMKAVKSLLLDVKCDYVLNLNDKELNEINALFEYHDKTKFMELVELEPLYKFEYNNEKKMELRFDRKKTVGDVKNEIQKHYNFNYNRNRIRFIVNDQSVDYEHDGDLMIKYFHRNQKIKIMILDPLYICYQDGKIKFESRFPIHATVNDMFDKLRQLSKKFKNHDIELESHDRIITETDGEETLIEICNDKDNKFTINLKKLTFNFRINGKLTRIRVDKTRLSLEKLHNLIQMDANLCDFHINQKADNHNLSCIPPISRLVVKRNEKELDKNQVFTKIEDFGRNDIFDIILLPPLFKFVSISGISKELRVERGKKLQDIKDTLIQQFKFYPYDIKVYHGSIILGNESSFDLYEEGQIEHFKVLRNNPIFKFEFSNQPISPIEIRLDPYTTIKEAKAIVAPMFNSSRLTIKQKINANHVILENDQCLINDFNKSFKINTFEVIVEPRNYQFKLCHEEMKMVDTENIRNKYDYLQKVEISKDSDLLILKLDDGKTVKDVKKLLYPAFAKNRNLNFKLNGVNLEDDVKFQQSFCSSKDQIAINYDDISYSLGNLKVENISFPDNFTVIDTKNYIIRQWEENNYNFDYVEVSDNEENSSDDEDTDRSNKDVFSKFSMSVFEETKCHHQKHNKSSSCKNDLDRSESSSHSKKKCTEKEEQGEKNKDRNKKPKDKNDKKNKDKKDRTNKDKKDRTNKDRKYGKNKDKKDGKNKEIDKATDVFKEEENSDEQSQMMDSSFNELPEDDPIIDKKLLVTKNPNRIEIIDKNNLHKKLKDTDKLIDQSGTDFLIKIKKDSLFNFHSENVNFNDVFTEMTVGEFRNLHQQYQFHTLETKGRLILDDERFFTLEEKIKLKQRKGEITTLKIVFPTTSNIIKRHEICGKTRELVFTKDESIKDVRIVIDDLIGFSSPPSTEKDYILEISGNRKVSDSQNLFTLGKEDKLYMKASEESLIDVLVYNHIASSNQKVLRNRRTPMMNETRSDDENNPKLMKLPLNKEMTIESLKRLILNEYSDSFIVNIIVNGQIPEDEMKLLDLLKNDEEGTQKIYALLQKTFNPSELGESH